MRQNVSVTHKTRSALYEIEYRLEYILRKINFEKLRISIDWWMMFCKFTIYRNASIKRPPPPFLGDFSINAP